MFNSCFKSCLILLAFIGCFKSCLIQTRFRPSSRWFFITFNKLTRRDLGINSEIHPSDPSATLNESPRRHWRVLVIHHAKNKGFFLVQYLILFPIVSYKLIYKKITSMILTHAKTKSDNLTKSRNISILITNSHRVSLKTKKSRIKIYKPSFNDPHQLLYSS